MLLCFEIQSSVTILIKPQLYTPTFYLQTVEYCILIVIILKEFLKKSQSIDYFGWDFFGNNLCCTTYVVENQIFLVVGQPKYE